MVRTAYLAKTCLTERRVDLDLHVDDIDRSVLV
jgi:hypothetical protein